MHHQHLHDGRVHALFAAQSRRWATRKVCSAMKGAEFPRSQPFVASPQVSLFGPIPLQKTPCKNLLGISFAIQNAGFWTLGKARSKSPITVREPQIGTCRVTLIKTYVSRTRPPQKLSSHGRHLSKISR